MRDASERLGDGLARLVRPRRTLVLGVPNVLGVIGWFMRRLAPRRLASHNPSAMDLDRWGAFEERFRLERRFPAFVGGFEPGVFSVIEERTPVRVPTWAVARVLQTTVGRLRPLRRSNHPRISGYLLGIWRVPIPPG